MDHLCTIQHAQKLIFHPNRLLIITSKLMFGMNTLIRRQSRVVCSVSSPNLKVAKFSRRSILVSTVHFPVSWSTEQVWTVVAALATALLAQLKPEKYNSSKQYNATHYFLRPMKWHQQSKQLFFTALQDDNSITSPSNFIAEKRLLYARYKQHFQILE